jgi:serine/threonine protein kinase
MNPEKVCYGCFREKEPGVCPYCGYDDTSEQPFLALPPGTILNGRYLTGKVLGVGGFGITYLGYDLTLDIKVAIKEYMPSGLATRYKDGYTVTLTGHVDKEYAAGMERFLEEARILAKLQNLPNIVSVQNYFKENSTAYFVMEYIEGMSLKEYLSERGGSISYPEALAILLPVMKALTEVHTLNLMHRDISPDNIYITTSGESRLLDFGAARFSMGDNKSVSVILKHGYAPEEQYSSHGNQGPWTDIYAMGATLYHCVTGIVPPDSIERIQNDTLKKPSEMGVRLPASMERALLKALSIKAEDRYPNMHAFIDALSGKKSDTVADRVTAGVTQRASTIAGDSGKGRFSDLLKTKPWLRWVIAGAALAVVMPAIIIPVAVFNKKHTPVTSDSGTDTSHISQILPLPGVESSSSDAGTEVSTPTPTPEAISQAGEITTHDITGYGAEISIPSDWTEDKDSWAFTSPDSRMAIGLELYYYQPQMACYSLDDVENNAEATASWASDSLGATGYQMKTAGPQRISGQSAYQIDFRATQQTGGSIDVVLIFTEPQNGYGLYMVTGACAADDEEAYSSIRRYMDTFHVTGQPNTTFSLYQSRELNLEFIYRSDETEEEPTIVQTTLSDGTSVPFAALYLFTGDDTQLIEAENVSVVADSAEEASDLFYKANQSIGADLNEPYTETWGGVEWTLWDGSLDSYSLTFGAAEIDGQIYVVGGRVLNDNADTATGLCQDIMSTLRPY